MMKYNVGVGCALGLAATLAAAAPAAAGSTSAPGFTSGIPIFAIAPEGLYYLNQTQSSWREVGNVDVRIDSNVFFFFYQSPWTLAGGSLSFILAPSVVDVSTSPGSNEFSLFNTYGAAQISWQIADGLYAGYRFGGYIEQHGATALDYDTIEQRAGLTYLKDGWQATANFMWGIPVGDSLAAKAAPDYGILDWSVTKKLGKLELGIVGHASTDLNAPVAGYRKQSQVAVGGLVGYDFGGANVQVKLTQDVSEEEYGGKETVVWTNLTFPLWTAK